MNREFTVRRELQISYEISFHNNEYNLDEISEAIVNGLNGFGYVENVAVTFVPTEEAEPNTYDALITGVEEFTGYCGTDYIEDPGEYPDESLVKETLNDITNTIIKVLRAFGINANTDDVVVIDDDSESWDSVLDDYFDYEPDPDAHWHDIHDLDDFEG